MAKELYTKYNVGSVRLKFTYSRASTKRSDQIPGLEELPSEDVVLGLFDGFMAYKKQNPEFDFILSPCFRKEEGFFDSVNYQSKKSTSKLRLKKLLHFWISTPIWLII